MDENGDAAGNYTILARKTIALDEGGKHNYGLFPIGTFSAPDGDHIPVYFLIFIFNCFHLINHSFNSSFLFLLTI